MATLLVETDLDFSGGGRATGLPNAVLPTEPVPLQQLQQLLARNNFKDDVRAGASANVSLAAPGATIGGVTMALNDRFLARGQTAQPENGLYVFNGAATPATRTFDAANFDDLEAATVRVTEGADAGTRWVQTQINGTLGSSNVVWSSDQGSAPAATETTAGIAEVATQAETDAGALDNVFVTPLKLRTSPFARKSFSATIGDGSATSYAVTHNLGTDDVNVTVRETGGSKRVVLTEVRSTSATTATVIFNTAPASNSRRVTVTA